MKREIIVKCIACGAKKDAMGCLELPLCEKCGSPMLVDRVAMQGERRKTNRQQTKSVRFAHA